MEIQQLTQPIINPIAAFDATLSQEITFLVIGGAQVLGNRIVISDNQTGDVVYDNKVTTMKLSHVIPANTLTNGGYYNVVIYTLGSLDSVSSPSVPVPFYCYSQPVLTINNIPATETIENGTYTFQGNYLQQENEVLDSYQFILYDSNKNILSKSDVIYYQTNNSLSYTFVGMSNDTSYYIELKGQTVNSTLITTGLLYFTVRYSQPASFAIVDLVNDCANGYIQISSNIVAIDGKAEPAPPVYIDNKEVDLRRRQLSMSSNMNDGWFFYNPQVFNIEYVEKTDTNNITVDTAGGWEIVFIPLALTPNKRYSINFDCDILTPYEVYDGYDGIRYQALSKVGNYNNLDNEIASGSLSTEIGSKNYTLEFVPETETVYFAFNFGVVKDYTQVKLKISNIKLWDDEVYVKWDDGFDVKDDFIMRVWGRGFEANSPIITMKSQYNTQSSPNKIEMKWMIADVLETLPDYTLVEGKNISIVNGYETNINDLSIYGNSEQIKKDSVNLGKAQSLTLNTTKNMYLDIDVYGNSEQKSYSGKNKLDFKKILENANAVYTERDGVFNLTNQGKLYSAPYKLNLKPNTTYTIYQNFQEQNSTNVRLSIVRGSNYERVVESYSTSEAESYRKKTFTTDESSDYYIRGDWSLLYFPLIYNEPILVEGTDVIPYEPYTGGIPSPNPDYPQEIETVGSNVNLFDGELELGTLTNNSGANYGSTKNTRSKNYLAVEENTTYALSDNISGSFVVHAYNKDKTWIKLIGSSNYTGKYIFTTPAQTAYIRFRTNETDLAAKIKLEKGSTITPYSPPGMGCIEIDVGTQNLFNINGEVNQVYNGTIYQSGNTVSGNDLISQVNTNTSYAHGQKIYVGAGNTVYFSAKLKSIQDYKEGSGDLVLLALYNDNTPEGATYGFGNHTSQIINVDFVAKTDYIYAAFAVNLNKCSSCTFTDIMVTTIRRTDYVEYGHQTLVMPIQQEMLEGDYIKDIEHHEWGKAILSGNEDVIIDGTYSGITQFKIAILNVKKQSNPSEICVLSNYFLGVEWNNSWTKNNSIVNRSDNSVRVMTSKYTTIDGFKAWLKSKYDEGNPVIVYYKLATPTNLKLAEEQKAIRNTLVNAYEPTTDISSRDNLSILEVSTTPTPSPKLPSKIYSSGDVKNQLEELGEINVEYNQGYFQTTDTNFVLKPDFVYNLSFDYTINSSTTDVYFTISYKSNGEIFDITDILQYASQTIGRNNFGFIVPTNIPSNSTLSIKFARTIIPADISVTVSHVSLTKGRFETAYQAPNICNIYPTATQKNIFNYNDIYYIRNENATLTYIQNGFSSEVVTTGEKSFFEFGFPNILQPGNKYTISYDSYGSIKSAKIYTMDKETGETLEQIVTENGVFTAPSNLYDIKAEFILDDTVEDNQVQVWNIQLESGETVTGIESYISNSTDLTLITPLRKIGNYRDLVCLESPNILNPETQIAIVKGSTTYSLSQSGTDVYKFDYINEDDNVISSKNMANGQFTTPDNCVKIKFNTTSDIIITNKLQVNLGDTAMVYYPYVNEPSVIRYIKEIILTGDESWAMSANKNNVSYYLSADYSSTNNILKGVDKKTLSPTVDAQDKTIALIICNYFKIINPYSLFSLGEIGCCANLTGNETQLRLGFSLSSSLTDLTTFKAWLKSKYNEGNPVIVNYILANPTVEQLSSDNVLALKKIKTYDESSNVFTNNSMPANIDFSYIRSQSEQESKNAYITLKCWSGHPMPYFIHSNYIDIPKETDKVFIWLRRRNNLFDLRIENLGDYSEDKPGDKGHPQVSITVDEITTTTITITTNTIDTATLKNIKFSKNNGSDWDAEIPLDGLSSSNTYTFTGLSPNVTYPIRAEATNINDITGGITQQITTNAN